MTHKRPRPASNWIVEDISLQSKAIKSESDVSRPEKKAAKPANGAANGKQQQQLPSKDSSTVKPAQKAAKATNGHELSSSSSTSSSAHDLYLEALDSSDKAQAVANLKKSVQLLTSKPTKPSRSRLLSTKLNKSYLLHRCLCELATRVDHKTARPLLEQAAEAFPTGIEPYERLGNILLFSADTPDTIKDVAALLDRSIELGQTLASGEFEEDVSRLLEQAEDPDEIAAELESNEERELGFASSAAQKLALIYAGNGKLLDPKGKKITKLLAGLDYVYRLGQGVLGYPIPAPSGPQPGSEKAKDYVRVVEGALPESALVFLESLFGPTSDFWSSHSYNPYVSNGYFSYLQHLQMDDKTSSKMFQAIVSHLGKLATTLFPHLTSRPITTAEWWAHSRPHTAGHQLHFDSENEGITPLNEAGEGCQGNPRHPVVSCVVYLSDQETGGPTLVTDQTLASTDLTSVEGWLAYGCRGRIAFFDARYLHGVIPGRGPLENAGNRRRPTFMVGLWDTVTEQKPKEDGGLGGASQKFPPKAADGKALEWIKAIQETPAVGLGSFSAKELAKMELPAVPITGKVWEPVDDGPKGKRKRMAGYEDCFQGF